MGLRGLKKWGALGTLGTLVFTTIPLTEAFANHETSKNYHRIDCSQHDGERLYLLLKRTSEYKNLSMKIWSIFLLNSLFASR